MFDCGFEQMKFDLSNYANYMNKKLVEDWCKEAGITVPVGYYNELSTSTMTIYTNKPGYLVGYEGKYINRFIKNLNEAFNSSNYKVVFVEIKGDIVNYNE